MSGNKIAEPPIKDETTAEVNIPKNVDDGVFKYRSELGDSKCTTNFECIDEERPKELNIDNIAFDNEQSRSIVGNEDLRNDFERTSHSD